MAAIAAHILIGKISFWVREAVGGFEGREVSGICNISEKLLRNESDAII